MNRSVLLDHMFVHIRTIYRTINSTVLIFCLVCFRNIVLGSNRGPGNKFTYISVTANLISPLKAGGKVCVLSVLGTPTDECNVLTKKLLC